MDAETESACYPEIDDRFLAEWVEFGMTQMNAYLHGHARFARYCDERDNRNAPGFGRLESAIHRAGRDGLD